MTTHISQTPSFKKLRIAQIAPIVERVPPKKYGGTERVVYALTEELVKMGHDVTLFASGDSITSAKLMSVHPHALRESKIVEMFALYEYSQLSIGTAYDMQAEFDVIHDHCAPISLAAANLATTPVVMTLHGAFTPSNKRLYARLRKPNLVSISKAQAAYDDKANVVANVYNGLSLQHYPFVQKPQNYLLFIGRIAKEKGTHLAIDTAQKLKIPLIIAAKLDNADTEYFKQYIQPRLYKNKNVRWIGEVEEKEKTQLLSNAICCLHPITWPEPFGLTLIESMACGTPVVACNKGSIPEVIIDGKTGYVVEDIKGMIKAVQSIDSIDRSTCRRHALENFSATRMAKDYEHVYRRLLGLH